MPKAKHHMIWGRWRVNHQKITPRDNLQPTNHPGTNQLSNQCTERSNFNPSVLLSDFLHSCTPASWHTNPTPAQLLFLPKIASLSGGWNVSAASWITIRILQNFETEYEIWREYYSVLSWMIWIVLKTCWKDQKNYFDKKENISLVELPSVGDTMI